MITKNILSPLFDLGDNLVLWRGRRSEPPLRTVQFSPEGRVIDTHNWPLFQNKPCAMRDIIVNSNGELVALMTCGGIQSCKRTSGEDWAMVKVLR